MFPMKFVILFLYPHFFHIWSRCIVLYHTSCHVVFRKSVQLPPSVCRLNLGSVILGMRVRGYKNRFPASKPVNWWPTQLEQVNLIPLRQLHLIHLIVCLIYFIHVLFLLWLCSKLV
jgi:hypothetical protein